jgi:hypothetical protein
MRGRPLLALAAAAVLASAPAPAAAEVAAPETTEVFTGDGATRTHLLAHRFLLRGSERVLLSGRAAEPAVDYRLDPDAGTVELLEPLFPGQELRITYAWVPLDLPRDFVAVEPAEPTPADSARMVAPGAGPADWLARTVDQDLVIGGAKTVAIEAGSNRDANVEQSLRVSVTGTIGEDVRLTALLSDQNIPLQPEGNTQRLEELDEVLIRLDAPRASATLGDFVATRRGTAFGDFERRLSGAEGTARAGPGGARAIGASSRGSFRTREIAGQEGKQGPYVLAGDGLNPTGVIVAGSERVWLDGRELTRGETGDYVIDYSRGELEFTNRVLITEDSEIAVDFEVAEQEYGRNFYLGEGSYESGGGLLKWRTCIASEIDGHDPVNLSLSDERRAALEQAGDAPVLVSGVECGDGGNYVEAGDHFEYFKTAGADSGTCEVSFTFVGAGAGEYVRDRDLDTGLTFFRFLGPGLGDFTPGVLLGGPGERALADAGLRLQTDHGFRLDADGAWSRDDRNALSALDDGDNEGAAGRVALGFDRQGVEALGRSLRLRAESSFRGEQAEFRSLGRTRDVYLGEVWNFADTTRADESVGEVRASVEEQDTWSLGGAWGILDRPGRFRSTRREGTGAWRGGRVASSSLKLETVRREDEADTLGVVTGDLLRARSEVTTRFGMFAPGGTFWQERRENVRADSTLNGENDVEGGALLGIRPAPALRLDLRFARRVTDDITGGAWTRKSVARTWEAKAEADPGRSARVRLSWIRRELDFVEGRAETDRTTHLTRADVSHESLSGLLRGEYVYETTSRFFTDLIAGPQQAAEEPTLALNASARISLGGTARSRRDEESGPAAWRRVFALFRSETLARVEEETTEGDRRRIYLLDFSRFQRDDTTIFGKFLLREEVTLFPGSGPFQLTARWERIDTEDNRGDPDRIDVLSQRSVLRARNRVTARWTLESQGTRETDSRTDSARDLLDFDVRRTELREEIVFQPVPTTRLSGSGAWLRERNEATGARARGVVLGTAASFAVRAQGRFRGEVTWTHPTLFEGFDLGSRFRTKEVDQVEWRGSVDVRVSDWLNASVSYSGRALQDAPTTHLARAEARALF